MPRPLYSKRLGPGVSMSFRPTPFTAKILATLLLLACATNSRAQSQAGSLSGVVTDPSNAVIAKAAVQLINSSGESLDATTSKDGFYEFKGLAPGKHTLKAVAKNFALYTNEDVEILPGNSQQLNISLTIQIEEQKVEVTDTTTKIDVNPANNAGAVVMSG